MRTGQVLFPLGIERGIPRVRPWKELLATGAKATWFFSESFFVSNNKDDVMLWHLRLGHPSFKHLKTVFPKLFVDQDFSSFQCEICELAKHHRNSINLQNLFLLFIVMFGVLIGLILYPTKDGLSPLLMIILDFVGYIY